MKLDVKENLVNLEMYYRDVLGYNCYWKKLTKEIEDMHYHMQLDKEFLIIEVTSELHMLKYYEFPEDGKYVPVEQILKGELPIPKFVYMRFGTDEESPHPPPKFMVSAMPYEHELYTSSGIKWVYNSIVYAGAGDKTFPIFDYFLYCYDRNCLEFKAIPVETVNEIEDYLRKKGRPIFDTI